MKWIMCAPLANPDIALLETGVSVCVTRYTMCKRLLIEKINMLLEPYGKKIEDFSSGKDLVAKIRELIESSNKITKRGIRSIDEKNILSAILSILLPAYASSLSILGVECEQPILPRRGQ